LLEKETVGFQKHATVNNYTLDKDPKKKIVSVNFSHALFSLLDFFTLENATDMLCSNISKEFQLYTA
jgi:hypothetical protein